jgi:hypothetical protein
MEAARGDTHGSTIVTPAYIPVLDTSGRILSLHRIQLIAYVKAFSSAYSAHSSIFAVALLARL